MPWFFSLSYWFNTRAIPFTPITERVLLVFFTAFTLVGVACYLGLLKKGLSKPMKRVVGRFAGLLTGSGLVGLLLWFVTYQGIPVLSMRVFYLPWIIWVVWGVVGIYRYLWIEIPNKQKLYAEQVAREKWIPKSKK